MATESYPDFVEAVRQRKALSIVSVSPQGRVEVASLPAEYRAHDLALPSFDFGYVFDPNDRSFIGKQTLDKMWAESLPIVRDGKFRIPFPECMFLFRYRETAQKYETVNLVHLWETDDGTVICNTFYQQDMTGITKQWTKAPFQFEICAGNVLSYSFDDAANLSYASAADYQLDAHTKYTECVHACWLLRSNRVITETDEITPRLEQVNRGRTSSGKLNPLPATRVIRFDRATLVSALPQGPAAPGSPKSPHERRGHYRKLRSGRETWVNASRIRGGQETQPQYEVKSTQ